MSAECSVCGADLVCGDTDMEWYCEPCRLREEIAKYKRLLTQREREQADGTPVQAPSRMEEVAALTTEIAQLRAELTAARAECERLIQHVDFHVREENRYRQLYEMRGEVMDKMARAVMEKMARAAGGDS